MTAAGPAIPRCQSGTWARADLREWPLAIGPAQEPTIPFPPKRPESPPVLPGHADVIVKLIEQRTRLAVSTRGEQGWEEDVLDALIIRWVEVKELLVVADRFVRLAQLLQSLRQPETGTAYKAWSGSCPRNALHVPQRSAVPAHAPPVRDRLRVLVESGFWTRGLLCQYHICVIAVSR